MASIPRPRPTIIIPPVSRPRAPHPGLEIELAPVQRRAAASPLPALSRLAALAIWRPAFIALCLAALAGTAALYIVSMTGNLSVEGDNAIYIILAKALAAGHGYTNIQGPVPRIEAQFPFLFPVLLAPIVGLWGVGAVLQMEALVTAFALASFLIIFFLFRRWLGSAILALSIALGTASSDLIWSFSHKVLTEIPYMFFTLLACWWATRYAGQEHWRTWAGLLAALAAAAAFLTRTIGLGLCIALPLSLLLAPPLRIRRVDWLLRLKQAALTGVVMAVLCGGWTVRNRIVYSGQGHSYIGQFFLKQTYDPEAGRISNGELLGRAADNAGYYATVYQRMLGGHIWDHIPSSGDVSQALLAITIVGFLYAVIRRRTLAEFYMSCYVAIVLLWPWQDLRFAVPVLPFLVYYLANALILPMLLLARFRRIDPRVAAAMVLIPLVAPTAKHTLSTALVDRKASYHYEIDRLGEWPAYTDWRDFHAAAMWLRQNAVPGSTVINRSPNLLYLWTGLLSRNYPYSHDKAYMIRDITSEHKDYLIYDDFKWTYTTGLYVKPLLVQYPNLFFPLYRIHNTVVYQLLG